jgi:hypothetical protein
MDNPNLILLLKSLAWGMLGGLIISIPTCIRIITMYLKHRLPNRRR